MPLKYACRFVWTKSRQLKVNDGLRRTERKHEIKMTEPHELNRPVICLLYAVRGAANKKPANGFRLPIPSASTAHTINCASWVRSDCQLALYPIHFLNRIQQRRKASGTSYTTKSS